MSNEVTVYYGSVFGNAESIAQKIYTQGLKIGHDVKQPDTLNNFKEYKTNSIVIVCSTTGDGEFPENADKFYRRTIINNNDIQNINVVIIALGNSNYNKFCYPGYQIEKKFNNLGIKNTLITLNDVDVDQDNSIIESLITIKVWKLLGLGTFRTWINNFFRGT